MDITKEHIDALNAVVKVAVTKKDYQASVDSILRNYRKQANIPGFRKGQVPMGLIEKQYGRAVKVDEVNKLLQDRLGRYLQEEKLDVLGNPLPKQREDFDWDSEPLNFEFELGLAPDFEVKLKTRKAIVHYRIVADKKSIDEQVERIRKQFGKLVERETVGREDEVTGTYRNGAEGIENKATLEMEKVAGKKALAALEGIKVGDTVSLKTKGLFKEDFLLAGQLGIDREKADKLNVEVTFTVEGIQHREKADINQELLDQLYGPGAVTDEEGLRQRIQEESERQFVQQSDQKLMNDVTERLIEATDFDLPAEFLTKWMSISGEEPMSEAQAQEEYERSEKGIRYQLIESKIVQEHGIRVEPEAVQEHARGYIRSQMAQFGHLDPKPEEVDGLVGRILSNQEEVRRISQQVLSQRLLDLFKKECNLKVKELSFENFVKEAYA